MLICQNSMWSSVWVMRQLRLTRSIPSHSEWLTHQHRDTLSSIVGHPTLLSYLAIADGEAIGRVKFEMTEVCARSFLPLGKFSLHTQRMLQPCGPPPKKDDD